MPYNSSAVHSLNKAREYGDRIPVLVFAEINTTALYIRSTSLSALVLCEDFKILCQNDWKFHSSIDPLYNMLPYAGIRYFEAACEQVKGVMLYLCSVRLYSTVTLWLGRWGAAMDARIAPSTVN